MGNFFSNSKPKIIVVPGVQALKEVYLIEGGGQKLLWSKTTRLTSRNFHKILAESHFDIAMFFENAEKRTFTIDPTPGGRGIIFNNMMEGMTYPGPSIEKPVELNSDSCSLNTLVEAGPCRPSESDDAKSAKAPPLDMGHHYDPKTDTLFIDHRYTCVVNAHDRSRKWLMNGFEEPQLGGTVSADKFKQFGRVYDKSKTASWDKVETSEKNKDSASSDVGCLPIFL